MLLNYVKLIMIIFKEDFSELRTSCPISNHLRSVCHGYVALNHQFVTHLQNVSLTLTDNPPGELLGQLTTVFTL